MTTEWRWSTQRGDVKHLFVRFGKHSLVRQTQTRNKVHLSIRVENCLLIRTQNIFSISMPPWRLKRLNWYVFYSSLSHITSTKPYRIIRTARVNPIFSLSITFPYTDPYKYLLCQLINTIINPHLIYRLIDVKYCSWKSLACSNKTSVLRGSTPIKCV